jgi:hypothetical protein
MSGSDHNMEKTYVDEIKIAINMKVTDLKTEGLGSINLRIRYIIVKNAVINIKFRIFALVTMEKPNFAINDNKIGSRGGNCVKGWLGGNPYGTVIPDPLFIFSATPK